MRNRPRAEEVRARWRGGILRRDRRNNKERDKRGERQRRAATRAGVASKRKEAQASRRETAARIPKAATMPCPDRAAMCHPRTTSRDVASGRESRKDTRGTY